MSAAAKLDLVKLDALLKEAASEKGAGGALGAILRAATMEGNVDAAIDDMLSVISNGVLTVKGALENENVCPEAVELLWHLHRQAEACHALVILAANARRS